MLIAIAKHKRIWVSQVKRLSINLQKIDVRSALAVIADFTGINFVTSDSVQGEISVNLKDVPWDQALDVIMRSKGLSKRQTGNVIWVAPTTEIQEFEEEELKANAIAAEFAPLVSEMITVSYAKAEVLAEVIKSVGAGGAANNGGGADSNRQFIGGWRRWYCQWNGFWWRGGFDIRW